MKQDQPRICSDERRTLTREDHFIVLVFPLAFLLLIVPGAQLLHW
jgi:hypothetical protein